MKKKIFYRRLHTSKFKEDAEYKPHNERDFFPETDNIPKILEEDKSDLELPATQYEMLRFLKNIKHDKFAGLDGLPIEFYIFWIDI